MKVNIPVLGANKSLSAANKIIKSQVEVARVQPKLTIGQPNDKYEQQADRVADQVINSETAQKADIQKKTAVADRNVSIQREPILQKMAEEEVQAKIQRMPKPDEDLQAKQEKKSPQVAPQNIQTKIQQSKGAGSTLPFSTRSFMESRIGADFSSVRIHNDSNAHKLNAKLNAQAFATSNNIFFNQGKYNPDTRSGKHLLAHELTHTVQQQASVRPMIQKQDEEHYQFGRPPHDHTPGNWDRVQKEAKKNCDKGYFGQSLIKEHLECLCAKSTPAQVMKEALEHLEGEGIAEDHLKRYLSGAGGELNQNSNLKAMIKEDDKVRQWVSFNIGQGLKKSQHTGHFMIQQGHYDEQEYKYAFGGIDRVDWRYNPASKTVKLWFQDPYDFHPVYGVTKLTNVYTHFGKGDDIIRDTNCMHAAAVEVLKKPGDAEGAAVFIMKGEAVFSINVFDLEAEKPELTGPGATQEAM